MTRETGEAFIAAIDAMSIIIPGLMEWAAMLEDREHAEALFHIGELTKDMRSLMGAVNKWVGVES